MATLVVESVRPAVQEKVGDGTAAGHLDLEVKHVFVPYVFRTYAYKKDFAQPITLVLSKKLFGGPEVTIDSKALAAVDNEAFFALDVQLQHGESIRFRTEGANPPLAAPHTHSVVMGWDERMEPIL